MVNRKMVLIVTAVLVIGLIVGFSSAWILQAQTISQLQATANSAPITVANKQIRILATVNGKYFDTATFHGVVYKGGSNAEKAIFKAEATPRQFYDALIGLGAVPGNNVFISNATAGVTKAEGTIIDVYVTWNGAPKTYTLQEVLTNCTCNGYIKFGGNLDASNSYGTGCVVCLGTCPVGISSNSYYAYSTGVKFCGNSSLLPADGTQVTLIFAPRV